MKRIIGFLGSLTLIFSCAVNSPAQVRAKGVISGKVTDVITGKPIANVNLFLANTTFGSSTGEDGSYFIRNIPAGSYTLIVSHISYELQNIQITVDHSDSLVYDFSLKQRTIEMEGLNVTATAPTDWRKDLKKFTRLFLGESKNVRKTKIVNPEVIDFSTNPKTGEFTASSDSIIIVENEALGYRIHIILTAFNRNEEKEEFYYRMYPKFEPLKPVNRNQQKKWVKNRRKTYEGSFLHFLRALVRKDLIKSGFVLTQEDKPGRINPIRRGLDPLKNRLITVNRPGLYKIHFKSYIRVWHRNKGNSWIRQDGEVSVDSLGNYKPLNAIGKWGVWAQERVADLLPSDYDPDKDNLKSVPSVLTYTPAIDSLENMIRFHVKLIKQAKYITDALAELTFIDPEHSRLLERLHKDIIDLMNNTESAKWNSLKTHKEKAEFLRRFWLLRDMSFGTKRNERLEEHYKRLQFARTIYSALTPTGYDDRGRIYVKYGEPEAKQTDVMPNYQSIDKPGEIIGAPSLETWVYSLSGKHIIFNFVAKGWGYSLAYTTEDILPFRMEPNLERRNLAFGEIFRTRTDLDVRFAAAYAEGDKETEFKRILREQVTEQKKIPISVSRQFENISELNFFFKPALFENSRNEPVLISAYGFRENDIKFGKSVDGTEQAINIRTVARDRDLRDLSLTEHSVPVKPAGFDESGELISLKQIPIRTNYFYLIATVDNPVGKQKGFKDYTIKFPVYKDRQLHLSSVIFAKDISPVERQRKSSVVSPFVRHNLVIRMDPFTELRASQPVYLYFEIYDLQKNKEGKTEYGIEYTVTPVKKTGVLHFIAGLNPFKKSGGKISISYDQEGRENNDYFSVRLDLSQLVPGPYIMNVRVKDKTANVAKETKTDFVLQ